MKKYSLLFIVLGLITLAAVLYFVMFTESASDDKLNSTNQNNATSQTSTPAQPQSGDVQSQSADGSYISYEDYQQQPGMYNDGKIVYFFNAKWCPTCKALDTDIKGSLSDIPTGVAIVSVDYDTYTDLKKQYGVTYQHTLLQVDKDGSQIKKWSGGNTLESILQQI